jgi:hypothetical protein
LVEIRKGVPVSAHIHPIRIMLSRWGFRQNMWLEPHPDSSSEDARSPTGIATKVIRYLDGMVCKPESHIPSLLLRFEDKDDPMMIALWGGEIWVRTNIARAAVRCLKEVGFGELRSEHVPNFFFPVDYQGRLFSVVVFQNEASRYPDVSRGFFEEIKKTDCSPLGSFSIGRMRTVKRLLPP